MNPTIVNEWGIEWAEPVRGLADVTGPYSTAKEARDRLASSAFEGRVVWRTTTFTEWSAWGDR